MSELLTYRKMIAAGCLAALGGLTMTGCSEAHNYDGYGNSYRVRGVVHDVEDDDTIHINQDDLTVDEANGKAAEWFDEGKGQDWFSDEFNFDPDYNEEESGFLGECEHNIRVGHVYDAQGTEIDPQDLHKGDVVDIIGSIRDSNTGGKTCPIDQKNVFETVKIVE